MVVKFSRDWVITSEATQFWTTSEHISPTWGVLHPRFGLRVYECACYSIANNNLVLNIFITDLYSVLLLLQPEVEFLFVYIDFSQ